jgi:contact-dependent growth inhibition (CDI) system CdiI-like immunity protein
MAFSIDLVEEPASDVESSRLGLITIGSYVERFVAPIDYWDVTHYRHHWQQALTRIVQGFSTSTLVTSMYDPAVANFIYWWPMYRLGHTVYFQNHILFLNELKTPFDPNDPFPFVPERKMFNVDGEKISEWSASIADLESFLLCRPN